MRFGNSGAGINWAVDSSPAPRAIVFRERARKKEIHKDEFRTAMPRLDSFDAVKQMYARAKEREREQILKAL